MDYCLRPTDFEQFKSLLHELTTVRYGACAVSSEHMITSTFNTSLRGTDFHGEFSATLFAGIRCGATE